MSRETCCESLVQEVRPRQAARQSHPGRPRMASGVGWAEMPQPRKNMVSSVDREKTPIQAVVRKLGAKSGAR